MSCIAYVNGRYLSHSAAGVSIDDCAFVFGDGVYEVCEVRGGAPIDASRHLARLARSLAAVRIAAPLSEAALRCVMGEVIVRNRVRDGLVYLQVSRGAARRDHGFPAGELRPGLVVTAKSLDPRLNEARAAIGVKVVTRPDERWAHPHIKTLQLLPNVLAKQSAREAGAFEAWFVDRDGFITDGASTNAWIVSDGKLVTRQTDDAILAGVARATLIDVAESLKLRVEQRPFTPDQAYAAAEAFLSSATTIVLPVIEIDGRRIGDVAPGPVARSLRRRFHEIAARG